jgi:hypothetical protein
VVRRVHNRSEEIPEAESLLVEILSEMLKSALEWEAAAKPEPEPEIGLHPGLAGIDCPPSGPRPQPVS